VSDPRVPEDRPAKAAAQFLANIPTQPSTHRAARYAWKFSAQEVRSDTRARLAYLIRAELVCCDIYEKVAGPYDRFDKDAETAGKERATVAEHKAAREAFRERLRVAKADGSYHGICYYGEWSARLCETGDLPEGELIYGEWNPAWGEPCEANRPKVEEVLGG
jgi:hypothetical protein